MRNTLIKPALALALAITSVTPAFAGPLFVGSQSLQDLSQHNDFAATTYLTFALGGKKQPAKERFRSGLRLQMRNAANAPSLQRSSFAVNARDINFLDLSMNAKGLNSLQLNGVPLRQQAYMLNAGEDGAANSGMRSGLLIAGGVILAIGVAAAAAGGGNDNENNNDRDGNR